MANDLAARCANSQMVSLREQSISTIQAAIHSPHDAGEVLKRINQVLATFYDPNLDDPETRAGVREEFVRALAGKPTWAIHRAFDNWVRTRTRRPSPSEIVILVGRELQPMTDELSQREKIVKAESEKPVNHCDPEAAKAICELAGFTPKRLETMRAAPMATTFADAETAAEKPKLVHWSETASPDGPEMSNLRRIRDENPLIQAAREAQARRSE